MLSWQALFPQLSPYPTFTQSVAISVGAAIGGPAKPPDVDWFADKHMTQDVNLSPWGRRTVKGGMRARSCQVGEQNRRKEAEC